MEVGEAGGAGWAPGRLWPWQRDPPTPLHRPVPLLARPASPSRADGRAPPDCPPKTAADPRQTLSSPARLVTLTCLRPVRRKDAQQRCCSPEMLGPDARRCSAGGGHSRLSSPASGCGTRAPAPCPGGAGRGGARPGRAVEEGRTRVRKDDTVAEGRLRSRPDPTWINPPGFPSLVSSACPLPSASPGAGDGVLPLQASARRSCCS